MFKNLPPQAISAYERWELAALGEEETPSAAPSPEEPAPLPCPLPTAADIEQIHQQAQQDGYAAGLAEAHARMAEAAQAVAALHQNLSSAAQQLPQLLEQEVLDLVLTLTRRMLGQALQARPELVLEVVREALSCLPRLTDAVRIRIHPQDAAILQESDLLRAEWQVCSDPAIAPGGCMVETDLSCIDARLDTRWERLIAQIGCQDAGHA